MSIQFSRRGLMTAAAAAALAGPVFAQTAPAGRASVLDTMRRATRFMVDEASVGGGYVWSALPDFSRRWGELEASPTMIWVQPPGTGTMGHLFLDAYHATRDEAYYAAAVSAARALVRGQHPSGGWNYVIDTAGEDSLRRWYDTYGKNAWRMEEFQHYYGNATFDDAGTSEASQFLLRLYLEKREREWRAPLNKAIQFVLDSQYPNGGWPQRYPLSHDAGLHGRPDYTGYITFNDDVAGENIKFLIFCYQTLGERRLLDPIRRAMDCFLACQQPAPQAGWGLQHNVETLKPSAARTYEPEAYATHTTAANIGQLFSFYRLTGDRKYIARVPEALDWLESVRLPQRLQRDGRTHPTFIQPGTNKPLYVHRRGSNVVNGAYYVDGNPEDTVIHYGSFRSVNVAGMRTEYDRLAAMTPEAVSEGSPLLARQGSVGLPKYFTLQDISVSDMTSDGNRPPAEPVVVAGLISGLNARGYWPTPLRAISNPYIGDGSPEVAPGEYRITRVGDASDTSPYITDFPVMGVSTGEYIKNMGVLIQALEGAPAA
ncbi:pectate lyase [Brevundimonas sp. Root1423]|uniref:pectate lyase n=1 Tax=Brevundimonas sp. Root1423 TaxID=1736462 RepID=UPI0006F9DDAC|nr:pectate lyase [Brevundimonas sp. Root1423]KQY75481.1 pectate lyase [Brevundimonas sp. Root1423]